MLRGLHQITGKLVAELGKKEVLQFWGKYPCLGFPDGSAVKNPPAMQELWDTQV